MTPPKLIGEKEAARLLGLTLAKFRERAAQARLEPAVQLRSGRARYREEDVKGMAETISNGSRKAIRIFISEEQKNWWQQYARSLGSTLTEVTADALLAQRGIITQRAEGKAQ